MALLITEFRQRIPALNNLPYFVELAKRGATRIQPSNATQLEMYSLNVLGTTSETL